MWQIVANLGFVTGFAIDLQTRKPKISPRGSGKRMRNKTSKKTGKKRKASSSGVRSKQIKRRKTTQVHDIFG